MKNGRYNSIVTVGLGIAALKMVKLQQANKDLKIDQIKEKLNFSTAKIMAV